MSSPEADPYTVARFPLRHRLLAGASGLAFAAASAAMAPAAAQNWNDGTGNWSSATNWTPNTVPNSAGASATINNGGTANVDSVFTVGTLTVGAGSGVGLLNNTNLTVNSSIVNGGTISLNSIGNSTELRIGGGLSVTLSGGGTVSLSNNANNLIRDPLLGTGKLINVDNLIQGAGRIGVGQLALDNQAAGVINANQSNALTLQPNGAGFTNEGLMEATAGGTLQLLSGSFDQSGGGTLLASGAGSTVLLNSSSIIGGTLSTQNSGTIATAGGTQNTLQNTTISNGSTVNVANNSSVILAGTINNTGSILLQSIGNNTDLRIADGTTLTGGGVLSLSDNPNNRIWGAANTGTEVLTNANNTISGAGQFGVGGSIGFINQKAGVVDATGTNALTLTPTSNAGVIATLGGGFVNQGLMEATGAGGLVLNGGQFNNKGGTITAIGAGNNVYLRNGAIVSGGLLSSSGGGVVQMVSGQTGTLDGASQGALTNAGGFVVTNNSSTFLSGTINNTGSILLQSIGNNTDLRIADGTTLTGGGVLSLSDNPNNRIWGAANTGTELLTNANNTISGAGQFGIGGSVGIVNSGAIKSTGVASTLALSPSTSGLLAAGLVNQASGLVESGAGSAGLVITQGAVNNQGTMQALDSALTYNPGVANQNASGGVLTGGTWNAISSGNNATLSITGGPIVTDAANITLSGAKSAMQAYNGSTYVPLETSLTTIAAVGQLHVLNDRNYTTTNDIANAGLLNLGGGTFSSHSLTNTGTQSGFGTQTSSVGPLANSGQVIATGGDLILAQGVTGTTGSVTIANGASLDVSGAASGNTVGTLLHNGANLNLGSQNITVSQDYDNANFGSGNSFNRHANITCTGSILAAGSGLGIALTGTGVSGGTLALGNVHVGSPLAGPFDINWSGTGAPVLRGGVQTTSGIGVSAPAFARSVLAASPQSR